MNESDGGVQLELKPEGLRLFHQYGGGMWELMLPGEEDAVLTCKRLNLPRIPITGEDEVFYAMTFVNAHPPSMRMTPDGTVVGGETIYMAFGLLSYGANRCLAYITIENQPNVQPKDGKWHVEAPAEGWGTVKVLERIMNLKAVKP